MQTIKRMPQIGGVSLWRIILAFFLLCMVIALFAYQVSSILGYRQSNSPLVLNTSYVYSGQPTESYLMRLVHRPGFNTDCNHVGVSWNGSNYSFAQLEVNNVSGNYIVTDPNDCPIYLRGIEAFTSDHGAQANLNPTMTPDPKVNRSRTDLEDQIAYVATHIPINMIRLSLNPVWWTQNYVVPNLGLTTPVGGNPYFHYQDWVKQLISWIESYGMYVELDMGSQFTEPPCDTTGMVTPTPTFCGQEGAGGQEYQQFAGTQGAAQANDPDCPGGGTAAPNPTPCDTNAPNETSQGNYIVDGYSMWSDIASYAVQNKDTAIIYDTVNESHDFQKGMLCTPTPATVVSNPTPYPGTCPYQWQTKQESLFDVINNTYTSQVPPQQIPLLVTDYGIGLTNPDSDYSHGLYYDSYTNLVWDHHIYLDDYQGYDNQFAGSDGEVGSGDKDGEGLAYLLSQYISDANLHHHAFIVNEWGGGDASNTSSPYNTDINLEAQGQCVTNSDDNEQPTCSNLETFGLDYYVIGNLTDTVSGTGKHVYILNCEGVALLNDNLNVWGSPPPGSVTPTVTPTGC